MSESLTPLVYHGGAEGIETFHSTERNRAFVAWFTDDKRFAQVYAGGHRGGALYSARLEMNNPLDLSGKYDLTHSDLLIGADFCRMANLDPTLFDKSFLKDGVDHETLNSPAFVSGLVKSGYDGLIIDEQGVRTFAITNPSQVVGSQRITPSRDG